MLTAEHHEWVFQFTGIHPGHPPEGQDGGPPLSPVPEAGGDKQSQAFMAEFKPVIAAIDSDLGFTADHAEAEADKQRVAKRETVIQACGAALKAIDPADENKAKSQVTKTLAAAKAVQAEVSKFRQAAEKAFNDWTSREPKFDDLAHKLEEMDKWGHPKAPGLNQPIADIAEQADERRFTDACQAFDALPAQFNPIYEDYIKQKDAQSKYEPARAGIDPRLQLTQVSEFKTLEPMQAEFPGAITAMDAAVQSKDYVNALKIEGETETKLTAYETALADLRAKKKAYDDELAAVQPKLDQAGKQAAHKPLQQMKSDLDAVQQQMVQSAQIEDFAAALSSAQDLGTKADTYNAAVEKLEQEKKDYESDAAKIESRVADADKIEFKALADARKDIDNGWHASESKAADEDYAGASKELTDLEPKLDQFEQKATEIAKKKQEFLDGRAALEPKLLIVANPPHPKLKNDEQAITDTVHSADQSGADEDFESAAKLVADADGKADAYADAVKQLEAAKKTYEEALGKAKPDIDAMMATRIDALAPMQQAILAHQQEIEKLAADESYDDATKSIDALMREIDDYKKSDAAKIYVIKFGKDTYVGTESDLVAIKAKIAGLAIAAAYEPLRNRAELQEGQYKSLQVVNDNDKVISWVVSLAGGADLGAVGSAVAAQGPAVEALHQGVLTDPASAKPAYDAAWLAVEHTAGALNEYMTKLEIGGSRTVTVLQAIEVVAFAVAAACGAAIIAPAGSTLLATMTANGVSSAGFGALEEAAKQGGGALTGIDAPKGMGDAGLKVFKSAALNGIGAFVGGGAGRVFKGKVLAEIVTRQGIVNQSVKQAVADYIEGAIAGALQTVIANMWDVYNGNMTWEQLEVAVVENIVGGLKGVVASGKLPPGKFGKTAALLTAGGAVLTVAEGVEIKKE